MDADTLTTTDVVVVGAGIAGLCTAWELRRRGLRVAVIEQQYVSYGASGRNPGVLWLQTRRSGVELDLARFGKRKLAEYAEELGDVFDFRERGGLFFYETEAQREILEDYVADRRANDLDIGFVDRAEALEHCPILPDTALGAVYCADDAQIDAPEFCRSLSAACVRDGVQIFEDTTVMSVIRTGGRAVGVRTIRGDVHAAGVVWATGAWATTLRAEGIRAPVATVRVGQLVTQPVDGGRSAPLHGPRGVYGVGALQRLERFDEAAFAAPAVGTSDSWFDYDDLTAQNRGGSLYIGHSLDGRGSLNPHVDLRASTAMLSTALDRFGRYSTAGVTGLWAGLGSDTPDYLPLVGAIEGIHLNVGHSWGVSSGPASGQVLAELVVGEESRFGPHLAPDRLDE